MTTHLKCVTFTLSFLTNVDDVLTVQFCCAHLLHDQTSTSTSRYLHETHAVLQAQRLSFSLYSGSSLGMSASCKPASRFRAARADMAPLVEYVALPMCGNTTARHGKGRTGSQRSRWGKGCSCTSCLLTAVFQSEERVVWRERLGCGDVQSSCRYLSAA